MAVVLDLPIKWLEIERSLQTALQTKAVFGPSKSAQLIGQGAGFLSKIALLFLDWQSHEKELPSHIVLKVCTRTELADSEESIKFFGLLNNNEATAYKNAKYGSALFENVPVAEYYFSKMFTDDYPLGYVAIGFVKDAKSSSPFKELPKSAIHDALNILASLTINSIKKPELLQDAVGQGNGFYSMMEGLMDQEKLHKQVDTLSAEFPELSVDAEFIRGKLRQYYDSFEYFAKIANDSCSTKILCHGDMWAPNLLLNKEGNVLALIDWQTAHLGSPVHDLILICFSGILGREYEAKWKNYVELFYKKLSANLSVDELPWPSVEELIRQYEIVYPVYLVLIVLWAVENKSEVLSGSVDVAEVDELFREKVSCIVREVVRCSRRWHC